MRNTCHFTVIYLLAPSLPHTMPWHRSWKAIKEIETEKYWEDKTLCFQSFFSTSVIFMLNKIILNMKPDQLKMLEIKKKQCVCFFSTNPWSASFFCTVAHQVSLAIDILFFLSFRNHINIELKCCPLLFIEATLSTLWMCMHGQWIFLLNECILALLQLVSQWV